MKATLAKINIKQTSMFPDTRKNYEYFLNKIQEGLKIVSIEKEHLIIAVDEEQIEEQKYKDKTWYRAKNRRYGVFKDEVTKKWKILLQRR